MNIDNLDPKLRDKSKTCKSAEEVLALAKEEGYELSDEQLSSMSGGWGGDCENHSNSSPKVGYPI